MSNRKKRSNAPANKPARLNNNGRPRVLNRHIERTFSSSIKRYQYGPDDLLPQILIRLIASNGTAMRSVKEKAKYIYAGGFDDDVFGRRKLNAKKSANKILKEASTYAATFEGCAFYIRRNIFGEIADIDTCRFEYVRPNPDGSFIYNNTIGTDKYSKSNDKRISAFKGVKISADELRKNFTDFDDPGEIIYLFQESPFSIDFPIPSWFAGEFDVRTGAEFQAYDLENVINGFLASAIITFFGDIDDTTKDDRGLTEWDYYLQELKGFTGQVKNDDGLSRRGRIAAFNVTNTEEKPEVQLLSLDRIIGASTDKRIFVDKNVAMLFDCNPVLIGYDASAVIGDQQAMSNVSNEFARSVKPIQDMIVELFQELFPGQNVSISSYKPYAYIPDKILDDLDSNERRKLVGYPEKEIELKSEKQIVLDRLNSLSPLLSAEIVKRMDDKQLFDLIGLNIPEQQNPGNENPPNQ